MPHEHIKVFQGGSGLAENTEHEIDPVQGLFRSGGQD
jgi:hypothetical protein